MCVGPSTRKKFGAPQSEDICKKRQFADNDCLLYCDDPCSLLIVYVCGLDSLPGAMGPGAAHRLHTRSAATAGTEG